MERKFNGLRASIITGIFIVSFSLFYYFVMFLPRQAEEKSRFDAQIYRAKQADEDYRVRQMNQCLENAQEQHAVVIKDVLANPARFGGTNEAVTDYITRMDEWLKAAKKDCYQHYQALK